MTKFFVYRTIYLRSEIEALNESDAYDKLCDLTDEEMECVDSDQGVIE